MSSITSVRKDHALAYSVLLFLRRTCPEQYITKDGWVGLGPISFHLKSSRRSIRAALAKYREAFNNPEPIEDDGERVRATTCHSIDKVRAELIHPKYTPDIGSMGYFNVHSKNSKCYSGAELQPHNNRTYSALYLDLADNANSPVGQIVVDLYELARECDLYYVASNRSVIVRGPVPAKFIRFEPATTNGKN